MLKVRVAASYSDSTRIWLLIWRLDTSPIFPLSSSRLLQLSLHVEIVKLFLCLTKHYAIQMYGGVEV
jgi:hypothetical protein